LLLIYLSCAWIIGILLGDRLSIHPLWLLISLLPLPLIFIFRQRKKLLVIISLLILAVLGGMVRYQSSLPTVNENYVQYYNDQNAVELKGIISQAPDVRDKKHAPLFIPYHNKHSRRLEKPQGSTPAIRAEIS
jgi:uncharacterized membrane protein